METRLYVLSVVLLEFKATCSIAPAGPIRPSGEAPRTPFGSSQMPVSATGRPVHFLKWLMASASFCTPHWTALTLDKSNSPNSLFNKEGVIRPAFSTLPKFTGCQPAFSHMMPEWIGSLPLSDCSYGLYSII